MVLLFIWTASAARYALLVGSNDGGGAVEQLQWAEADAGRFAQILKALGNFDPSATVTLLHPDSAALDHEMRRSAARLGRSKAPENDLFLLYYSGHADGRDLLLGTSRYPLEKIKSCLDSLPSGVRIGVFDACQSGAVTAYKGGKRAEPFYLTAPQKIKGQVIIASAASNERAQESESLKGSIFSFFWLSGLRGS
ncbi:MAG: caspase family protein, partial [Chitinispirillaceae bacterium]|nr:caspase family protein [Chitinispirillaceae bacterium]